MMHLQAQSKNRKRHEDEEEGLGDVTEEAIDNIIQGSELKRDFISQSSRKNL